MPAADDRPAPPAPPAVRFLVATLATLLTFLSIAWAAELPRLLRLVLWDQQFLAAMLGMALGLVFLHVPPRGGERRRVPWYDALAAAAGLGGGLYIAVRYAALVEEFTVNPESGLWLGLFMLLLVLEGLRRTSGTALTVIVAAFVLYALVGHLVPGKLAGREVELDRLVTTLMLDPSALLGLPMEVATTIVVAFVLFGHLLGRSGGSGFFTDLSIALMGRYRGGPAKIAIVASGLFGTISGSAVSNVVSTGIVTIPLMRRAGYAGHVAGAIEAVASTGGQLMPPIMGAAAFLVAEFLQIPYADVVLAAVLPAVFYYAALFMQADLRAARDGITSVPEDEIPRLWPTLGDGWHFPIPFAVLIAALFAFNLEPETAAFYAAIVLLAFSFSFGYRGRRMTPGDIGRAVLATGTSVLDIIMITAGAGLIIGVLNVTGLSQGLTLLLVALGQGSAILVLLVAAGICIVLGMGMPTVGVYVLLAALVAPSLVELGIEPLAAHMFVLYFGMMSMITPPVAIAAFAAASLARADAMRTGWEAVRFGWPAYVLPFLFAFSPSLLLLGDAGQILLAVMTAFGGVWLVSVGLVGHMVRPLGTVARVLFIVAGLALMTPAGMFEGAILTDLAGFALGVVLVARELAWRRARALQ